MPTSFSSLHPRHLLVSTSVSVLVLAGFFALPTLAAETTIANGMTVTQQTVQAGDILTVQAGGTVQDNAIDAVVDSAAGTITINNQGTIQSNTQSAISALNAKVVVDNSSNILGQIDGIHADEGITSINNASTGVIGGGTGVGAFGGVTGIGTIANMGTIQGATGIQSATSLGMLTNSGAIQGATNFGVQALGTITTITNNASGTIHGGDAGVQANIITTLVNAGMIDGGNFGIQNDIGTISSLTNSGTILGGTDGIRVLKVGALTNMAGGKITGTLDEGIEVLGAVGDIVNAGAITGATNGIFIHSDLNSLINSNGGTIAGGNTDGVLVLGNIGRIDNGGTIAGDFRGVDVINLGMLDNTGTISSAILAGVHATTFGTVNNSGQIKGGTLGITASSANSLTNSGAISGGDGVSIADLTSLTNTASGTITATSFAVNSSNLGTVNNAGKITGGKGVNVFSSLGSLVNTGTIAGTTQSALDIASAGSIDNSGAIIGAKGGIQSAGSIGSLTNSGRISGASDDGVGAMVSIDSLINSASGHIASGGAAGVGTAMLRNLNNAGLIEGIWGLRVGVAENITNNGTIRGQLHGISSSGLQSITNSGTIEAVGATGRSILDLDPNANTVLNLNAGSVLIGHVDIRGGTDTLNVGPGLNLALTFEDSTPAIINTGKSAHVVIGNTVYVADASTFLASSSTTANLSGAIAGLAGGALDKGFDEKGVDGSANYWLEAIGGLSIEQVSNGGASSRSAFGGFVAGADFGPDADTRFGAFVGASRGVVDVNGQANNSDNYYVGIYGGGQFEDFAVKGTLSAGTSYGGSSRVIANNTLVTGLESARSSGDSYFLAPGVVFTKPWVTQDLSFDTSLALNYTGVFSGARSENLATGLSLAAATTHIFTAAGLMKLPMQMQSENGLITGDIHAGPEGRVTLNPNLNGTLAGTPVSFGRANAVATAGVLAGGALAFELDSGATLFSGLDAALRSDASASVVGNLGVKGSF